VSHVRTFGLSLVGLFLAVAASAPASATTDPGGSSRRDARVGDSTVVTHHRITVDGKVLAYTARAGFITLCDHSRRPVARMFFVAYTLDWPTAAAPRPLTFAWNGGPGSPASMLELGLAGPRRAQTMAEYTDPPPPFGLVDDESTWLRFTDLVFVDPVGTGYSYPVSPDDGSRFWNVDGDIASVAEFMRIYRERWAAPRAPVFITGESYGTMRAAGLAETLEESHVPLRGVILLSCYLNAGATQPTPGNDLPYVLAVPSYTAAAFAHHRLSPDLQSDLQRALGRAEAWATTQYAAALMKGDRLSAAERSETAAALSRYTGLDTAFVLASDLRVGTESFARHLLARSGKSVAHYDSRMASPASGGMYDPTTDPSLSGNGIGSLVVPYLREELGFRTDAFYAGPFTYGWPPADAPRADWLAVKWTWGSAQNGPVERGAALASAIRDEPSLHVFVASGTYDLASPFFATHYVIDHLGLDAAQHSRVEMRDYPSGHMMYLTNEDRERLTKDVEAFVHRAGG